MIVFKSSVTHTKSSHSRNDNLLLCTLTYNSKICRRDFLLRTEYDNLQNFRNSSSGDLKILENRKFKDIAFTNICEFNFKILWRTLNAAIELFHELYEIVPNVRFKVPRKARDTVSWTHVPQILRVSIEKTVEIVNRLVGSEKEESPQLDAARMKCQRDILKIFGSTHARNNTRRPMERDEAVPRWMKEGRDPEKSFWRCANVRHARTPVVATRESPDRHDFLTSSVTYNVTSEHHGLLTSTQPVREACRGKTESTIRKHLPVDKTLLSQKILTRGLGTCPWFRFLARCKFRRRIQRPLRRRRIDWDSSWRIKR